MEKNNKEIEKNVFDDEGLDNISGGYLFHQSNIPGGGADVWELIDDKTGEVLGKTRDYNAALRAAKKLGFETRELSYHELGVLRTLGELPPALMDK